MKVPLAAYQPSAVGLYWMTSGAMAVLLNLLLMEPRLKPVTFELCLEIFFQVSPSGQDPIRRARASEALPSTERKFSQSNWNESQINLLFHNMPLEAAQCPIDMRQCA